MRTADKLINEALGSTAKPDDLFAILEGTLDTVVSQVQEEIKEALNVFKTAGLDIPEFNNQMRQARDLSYSLEAKLGAALEALDRAAKDAKNLNQEEGD